MLLLHLIRFDNNTSTLQNMYTQHTLKSKISDIHQRTTLQIVPTCRNFFNKVHRKHTQECVKALNGYLRERLFLGLPSKKPQTLTVSCKKKMEMKNLLHIFRFQKAHLHTTNPQTQSRPMVLLQFIEEGRYNLLYCLLSEFPLGSPDQNNRIQTNTDSLA